MNIGFYGCLALGIVFGIIALILTLLGEKGAMLIAGFNTFLETQRNLYDKDKLVKAERNALIIWCTVLGVGAVLSYFVTQYCGIIAFVIWIIIFFKEFHWDAKKAFEKYKL